MSLIEGVGDEVTNFLVIVISSIIVYLAWRSTNVRDEHIPRTFLLIESNRRRLLDRVAQHPVTISILRNASQQSDTLTTEANALAIDLDDDGNADSTTSDQIDSLELSEPPSLQSILDEVGDIQAGTSYTSAARTTTVAPQSIISAGPQEIIRDMDSDRTDGIRHRRVTTTTTTNVVTPISSAPSSSQTTETDATVTNAVAYSSEDKTANTDNCTNENSENGNVIEVIPASTTDIDAAAASPTLSNAVVRAMLPQHDVDVRSNDREDEFRIKLKYLNDDLKLVKGCPGEAIGDFKKRNFSSELSDQKVVRLVFNGHVLQPDSKTLQACGLFDNCVVHCLVHTPRPMVPLNTSRNVLNVQGTARGQGLLDGIDNITENNAATNATDGQRLVYLGICLISLTLMFCWYFRIHYNHLFSWYSTIGLILLTALSLVVIPLLYLIERDVVPT